METNQRAKARSDCSKHALEQHNYVHTITHCQHALDSPVHTSLPATITFQSLVGVKFEAIEHLLQRLTAFACTGGEYPATSGLATARVGEKYHDLALGERVENSRFVIGCSLGLTEDFVALPRTVQMSLITMRVCTHTRLTGKLVRVGTAS